MGYFKGPTLDILFAVRILYCIGAAPYFGNMMSPIGVKLGSSIVFCKLEREVTGLWMNALGVVGLVLNVRVMTLFPRKSMH